MPATPLTPELFWLTLTVVMTALMWLPYIVNRLTEYGLWGALKNPRPDAPPAAAWAARNVKAHDNAVENLVIFAPLVLILQTAGISTELTATACAVYFFARAAHFFIYLFGIPLLRTLTFAAGFGAQMTLAATALGYL